MQRQKRRGRITGVHDLSSILKALRKIEQEESRNEKSAPAWPDSVHSARQTVKKESQKKIAIFTVVVTLCVLGAVMIYMGSKTFFLNKPANEPGVKAAVKTHDKPQVKPQIKIDKTVSFTENQSKQNRSLDTMVKMTPEAIERIKDYQRTQNKLVGIETNQPTLATQNNTNASSVPPSYSKEDNMKGGDIRIPEPDVTEKERRISLPEINNDARINIQAIAWAEDPSRRFAVINNSIIREGGSIDGITVVSIEDDMVFFSENGNEWRQPFVVR
jgi:hypothetical protein